MGLTDQRILFLSLFVFGVICFKGSLSLAVTYVNSVNNQRRLGNSNINAADWRRCIYYVSDLRKNIISKLFKIILIEKIFFQL